MNRVVVTGASSGIGEEFARQLAQQGYGLVLTARREERLQTLAASLSEAYGVPVDCIVCDLSRPQGAAELADAVMASGWAVSGLINNAGFGQRGSFTDIPLQRQLDMMQVNVISLIEMAYRFLPLLKAQRGSFVINVASSAAFQPGPGMAVYFASKAFVVSFSEALHVELKEAGVSLSVLCPGATETEFASIANMGPSRLSRGRAMSARDVVRKALRQHERAIVIPGVKNQVLAIVSKLSPKPVTRAILKWLLI